MLGEHSYCVFRGNRIPADKVAAARPCAYCGFAASRRLRFGASSTNYLRASINVRATVTASISVARVSFRTHATGEVVPAST